jgi:hypothetical protein
VCGRVPMMFENIATMISHVRKRTLRALAVSRGSSRSHSPTSLSWSWCVCLINTFASSCVRPAGGSTRSVAQRVVRRQRVRQARTIALRILVDFHLHGDLARDFQVERKAEEGLPVERRRHGVRHGVDVLRPRMQQPEGALRRGVEREHALGVAEVVIVLLVHARRHLVVVEDPAGARRGLDEHRVERAPQRVLLSSSAFLESASFFTSGDALSSQGRSSVRLRTNLMEVAHAVHRRARELDHAVVCLHIESQAS